LASHPGTMHEMPGCRHQCTERCTEKRWKL